MKNFIFYCGIIIIMLIALKGKSQPEGCAYDCLCEVPTIAFSNSFDCYHYCDCCPTCIYEPDSLIKFMNLHESDSGNIWQIAKINKGNWIGDCLSSYGEINNHNGYAIITDSINYYSPNNHSVFDIYINKPTCNTWFGNYCLPYLGLSFYYKCETDTLLDGLYIEVSFDNGLTYANVQDTNAVKLLPNGPDIVEASHYKKLRESYGISGKVDTSSFDYANNYTRFFVGFQWNTISQWQVPGVIFKFNFISDSINTYKKGVVIDFIEIYTMYEHCLYKKENNYPNDIAITEIPITIYSKIIFSNPSHQLYYLNITDTNGRSIFKGNTNEDYFNIGEIIRTPGIYIYNLYTEDKTIKTDKIIKL